MPNPITSGQPRPPRSPERKSRGTQWEVAAVLQCPKTGEEKVYVACEDGWNWELTAHGHGKLLYTWEEACEAANTLQRFAGTAKHPFVRMANTMHRREWPNTRKKRAELAAAWEAAEEEAFELRMQAVRASL